MNRTVFNIRLRVRILKGKWTAAQLPPFTTATAPPPQPIHQAGHRPHVIGPVATYAQPKTPPPRRPARFASGGEQGYAGFGVQVPSGRPLWF